MVSRKIAKDIQEAVKNNGGITKITTKFTTSNKETKIILNSAWVKEHCLFKDNSMYKKKDDYGKYSKQKETLGCGIIFNNQSAIFVPMGKEFL